MVFVSICTALYNYVPQGDNELDLQEGDLVYVLEKSTEDDWWRAKKRARAGEDEEPQGLIPNNYVEQVSNDQTYTGRRSYPSRPRDYALTVDQKLNMLIM